jgi:hypothetical protein
VEKSQTGNHEIFDRDSPSKLSANRSQWLRLPLARISATAVS